MSTSSYYRSTISWNDIANLESPYPDSPSGKSRRELAAISKQYSLSPDPQEWGSNLDVDLIEADDYLHTPKRHSSMQIERGGRPMSIRGLSNVGCLIFLSLVLLGLFCGYPVVFYVQHFRPSTKGGFNIGGTNASGQVPSMPGNWGLIDSDTPREAYFKPSWVDNTPLQLMFSDEFNIDGRTFYPGDDPYWEAADLHYWATNNQEWYDPEAITTANGSLVITLSEKESHGLQYEGGLISSWNKFCFTGGYLEATVQLPGADNIVGLWPAVWTMGNLGRAGYGASLEGMWPYTYDACDVGTAPNQTFNGLPVSATINGDPWHDDRLSFLPGQRLSRCTCPDDKSHPGPIHSDGTFVGRAAPEIDVFEAQVNEHTLTGGVSQSAQWAPFNDRYVWLNTSDNLIINDHTISEFNLFVGSITQQATSVVTLTNPRCYEQKEACFSVYGFEYKPGFDDSYITWVSDNKQVWTMKGAGVGPDPIVQISQRPVPQEPMYLIANLGMSLNFGPIDYDHIGFPVHMKIDYIRVYQREDAINIGCDPKDFPTEAYINKYIESYTNPNLTTWVDDYKQTFPKNSFLGEC